MFSFAQVLRSYDSRVRLTERSADVYLDDGCCAALVGGKAKRVLELTKSENAMDADECDEFWSYSSANRGKLLIIAIPYKEGGHVATSPTDFIPVMDHLQKLHNFGYAHGDI